MARRRPSWALFRSRTLQRYLRKRARRRAAARVVVGVRSRKKRKLRKIVKRYIPFLGAAPVPRRRSLALRTAAPSATVARPVRRARSRGRVGREGLSSRAYRWSGATPIPSQEIVQIMDAPDPPRAPRGSFFATYLPTFHWAATKGASLFQGRRGSAVPEVTAPPTPPTKKQGGLRPMPESKTTLRREAAPETPSLAPLRPSVAPQAPVQRGALGPLPESKTTLRREAPAAETATPVPVPSEPLPAPSAAMPLPPPSSFLQTYLPTFFSLFHRGLPPATGPAAPSPISGGTPETRLMSQTAPKKGLSLSLDALLKESGAPAAQGLPQGGRLTAALKPGEKTPEEIEAAQKALAEIRQESSSIRSLDTKADPELKAKQDAAAEKLLKELEEERREQDRLAKKQKNEQLKNPAKQEKPKEEPVVQKIKLKKHGQSGLSAFLQSIQYIGSGKERLAIIQNLATMMNAGLPLVDSLKTLQLEMRSKPMKKLMQRVVDSVENGSPFWRALEAQHFFSPHAIALIRIGEESGDLAENMEYLAEQQEKDQALRSKVKMAMIYPSIVITLMFVVVMGLGLFVLPNLVQVLFSLNVELPLVTRIVIKFTDIFTSYGTIIVPGSVGGVMILVILAKFTPLRVVSQWMIFRVPGVGRLAREATIARFGVILGGLLKAGVPLVEALHSLAEVTPIVSYRKFYVHLLEHINIGDSFAKSFAALRRSQKLLPPSVQQLVMTGERSGSLSEILLKIAGIYEKKANETAQKLPVILEPIILLFIGALVGTIAFAIIIPIYSIVGNVGH